MGWQMHQDDIQAFCTHYQGPKFHAAFMDAPYEMGFMNRDWDASGIAFDPETWKGIAKHLHHGAFLFVYAGTINDDLISVAMRKAGLRKHHKCVYWTYGSGMTKGTRLDTKIDERAGAEREVVDVKPQSGAKFSLTQETIDNGGFNDPDRKEYEVTAPATEMAKAWEGHRYGLQTLTPSAETILVFQKPYGGDSIDCMTETGAGALWIDGARIGVGEDKVDGGCAGKTKLHGGGIQTRAPVDCTQGRWPANFMVVHHPECIPVGTKEVKNTSGSVSGNEPSHTGDENSACYGEYERVAYQAFGNEDGIETVTDWDCHPECNVKRLGSQAATTKSSGGGGVKAPGKHGIYNQYRGHKYPQGTGKGDSGTVARYFYQAHWVYESVESNQASYCPKSSPAERNAGLADFEEQTVDDGRNKSLDNAFLRGETTRKNTHPTLKPISLNRHLATLLLPPDMYTPRRLFVPFAGAGSEVIGALLAGWEEIVGVELSSENVEIAEARLAFWEKISDAQDGDIKDMLKLAKVVEAGQQFLF